MGKLLVTQRAMRERCVSGRCGTRWIQRQAPTSPQVADQGKRDPV
ncbi:hypothetical protein STRIP9103_05547 [Streptomyces ipomoeae 91-03]|uniref:Uncharacterized protein n=1 Tax=Streptomyces ipomoeae 91-03 TaxID=698759 RepID=L1KPX8_9ACTN|nr:hypothetical protein STRIP9103_05547 [Streptomyces ipomoeae 91-03]